MVKKRGPLQVSDNFMNKLKALKRKIMMTGQEISLRELTDRIAKSREFQNLENDIMKTQKVKFDFNIKFDGSMV